jgi:hypothetical protein
VPVIVLEANSLVPQAASCPFFTRPNPISPQRVRGVVRFKKEVKLLARIHELDREMPLVDEFQVKELTARPNTCVKVVVLELEW